MTSPAADRRMLLVHAHPDDETIATGATMAKYVDVGAHVALVTCTLGEEGEILLDVHAHRAADREDSLGEHRKIELADAMKALGVTDHRQLGGDGKYRDSGMMGLPDNDDPTCFWRADLLVAAADLVAVIREVRPQVLVTYDDFGGYGHPDHIQAHRVAMYGAMLAAAPSFRPDLGHAWDIAKIYWTAFPKSIVLAGIAALKAAGETTGFAAMDPDDMPFVVDDALVTTTIDAEDWLDRKMAAMAAHATQISLEDGFFALSNNLGSRALGREYFRLVKGTLAPLDESNHETDLFAGL